MSPGRLTEIEARADAAFRQRKSIDEGGWGDEYARDVQWLLALVGDLEREREQMGVLLSSANNDVERFKAWGEAAGRELAEMHLATTKHVGALERELADARAALERIRVAREANERRIGATAWYEMCREIDDALAGIGL